MFNELQAIFRKRFNERVASPLKQFITTTRAQLIVEKLPLSAAGLLSAALAENKTIPVLILTPTEEAAEEVYDSLRYFTAENCAFHFASWGLLPFDQDEPPLEVRAKQLETLASLINFSTRKSTVPPLISASIKAIAQKFFTPEFLSARMFTISKGSSLDPAELIRRLVTGGYERMEIVESRGEFAVRGGIIDIYPPNLERPVRLDLFGNEVESIRYFDVYTQRSIKEPGNIDRIVILPAREKLLIDDALSSDALISFFDWLPASTVILCFNAESFKEILEEQWEEIKRHYAEAVEKGIIREDLKPEKLFLNLEQLNKLLNGFKQLIHRPLAVEEVGGGNFLNFQGQSFDGTPSSLDSYLKYINDHLSEDYVINIVCDNPGQVWRLEEILQEQGIPAVAEPPNPKRQNDFRGIRNEELENYVLLTVGDLHSGFVLPECKLIFLTDREIFGRYKKRHIFRRFYKGIPVVSVDEIRRGDYVVHVDYGIGKFLGIRQQSIDNKTVDLLAIEYQDNDKLLVPVDKIQYIQKYSGVEGYSPPLDKLGSKRWLLRKRKSQEVIEKMAKELLEIYAQRSLAEGYAYAPDSVWQTEFEATFPFEETPDQLQSIYEVKQDLQKPKPMDRLICGDVAYGKTEVAIRAAFKVAQEKKQIALLAPTTILAQQHFRTFTERFSGFPIKIEMLSRFRSPKEQREILHRLKYGDIDIIIGTHRLLSDDVEFFDLGLVIVDEEQRFGVRHKEKLKKLRASVDFITLTATPIPRTLYMALSGLRDMSLINTPPPGRLPIKTKIIHFDPELIQEAIQRELNRGGQVFFVHNRIHNIHKIAEQLQKIAPKARIAIAHGKMKESELERVMIDFVAGKYDILLSTTIIENGLDIPNVNTIIINRADAFGLAQLYQLRGRVGRDIRQAYAYLIVPKGMPITDEAVKRLAAIEEFTELGSGFNIAMRDLEIRGAGNLLGKEQHGCIASIGFDLYCQLLEQTIRRLKGEEIEEQERSVELKLRLDAYLPNSYISLESLRIGVYKRLAQARTLESVDELDSELRDRYGRFPAPVNNLLLISRLRILARNLGVKSIVQNQHFFTITTFEQIENLYNQLKQLEAENGQQFKFYIVGDNQIECRINKKTPGDEVVTQLYRLLQVAAEKMRESFLNEGSRNPLPVRDTIF